MLTAAQIRAARALVRWDQADIARVAGVSVETIKRLEGMDGPLRVRLDTLERIRSALKEAGVLFIDENGDGPGVRLRKGQG
jgi:transcriptional regulator with XRE-family HTH domain